MLPMHPVLFCGSMMADSRFIMSFRCALMPPRPLRSSFGTSCNGWERLVLIRRLSQEEFVNNCPGSSFEL